MEDKKIGISNVNGTNSVPDVNSASFHYPSSNSASSAKKDSWTNKMRENPWILATMVLGVVILVLLFGNFNLTGNVVNGGVSADDAASNLITYLNGVADSPVTLVNVSEDSGFYLVNVEYKSQSMPIYVTKDGSKYTPSLVPISGGNVASASASSGSASAPADIVKSDKPVIDLFVMSYCPYGTQEEKGLIPVIEALGDKVDFNLRFVDYSMHPTQGEVQENLVQYCIREEQNDKLVGYLKCFLEAGDSQSCLDSVGVDKVKLASCSESADSEFNVMANLNDKSSWLSGSYPIVEFDKELNQKYGVQGSPTLVINGVVVSSARDPHSLMKVICSAFNDAPSECDVEFSTQAYNPGFGYSLSATDQSAVAQCG